MNDFIQDFCCLCLKKSNEKCNNNSSKYDDNMTPHDKIKTLFLELSSVMNSDDRICMKCSDTVGFIYEFHKTCLRNINVFSSYKKFLNENPPKKQCDLPVDPNEWMKFKEHTLPSKEIKVEPPESPLNNDDTLCDTDFVTESHSSGVAEIKEEMEINYETCDKKSETSRLDSEIKNEETDFKKEWVNKANETSNFETLKLNIKDFKNISPQSTEKVVENQEFIEKPLQGVADEKLDDGRGLLEFLGIDHFLSVSSDARLNHKDSDSHIQLIHSEKKIPAGKEPHKCEFCGKLFTWLGKLNRHKLTHTGEKPHKCDICGKLFTQKGDLKRHTLLHTGDIPHKCDICGKLLSNKGSLKTHMLLHTDEKSYSCDICGNQFRRKHDVKLHMLVHTGEKPHSCDICGKLFGQIRHLNLHKLIHTDEKPHKCDICGKLFRRKEDLKRHSSIHTGEKPHSCDICGKLFERIHYLNSHKLIHTDEKPHECDICGKLFKRKAELKKHSTLHTDEQTL